jgi:hypothetical protein
MGEFNRYILRSFSRNILKGYNPINILIVGQNGRFEAFSSPRKSENQLKPVNSPILKPF